MSHPIETVEIDDEHTTEVYYEQDAGDPSREWDNYSEDEVQAWRDGEVYGYCLTRNGEAVGGCWGYYGGPDSRTWRYMLDCARDEAGWDRSAREAEAEAVAYWNGRDVVTVGGAA